jgi:2,4-dienoyl-CoA reductase-like NADH-dependent reductase (Old Yellow Enzyme family)
MSSKRFLADSKGKDLMSKLFEATKLNNMTLKNRFVRSATAVGMALVAHSIRD